MTNLEEEQDLLAEERLRIIGIVTGVCFVLIIPFVLNNIWNGRWLVSIAGALPCNPLGFRDPIPRQQFVISSVLMPCGSQSHLWT